MTTAVQTLKPGFGSIAKATGTAVVIAVLLNLILYFIATAAGWLPAQAVMGEVNLVPVLMFSIVPPILGGVFYFILTRFLPTKSANTWFLIIASVVLIVMAFSPVNLTSPTVGAVLILEIMHLTVGLPLMVLLTR